jgi:hypothetical protein
VKTTCRTLALPLSATQLASNFACLSQLHRSGTFPQPPGCATAVLCDEEPALGGAPSLLSACAPIRRPRCRRVGGYDSRLPIMEDADLCIRLHMAGAVRLGGTAGRRRTCRSSRAAGSQRQGWLPAARSPPLLLLLRAGAAFRRASLPFPLPVGSAARPDRRGQVVQLNRTPNHTSGRRLASWGRVHATGGWKVGWLP